MYQELEIKEKKRSNKARKSILKIGKKTIEMPTYGTYIQKGFEINLLCSDELSKLKNVGLFCSKVYNIDEAIREKEGRVGILNLAGESIEKEYKKLKNEKIWLIDPCTDEPYYKNPNTITGFIKTQNISKEIKEVLVSMDGENYNTSWKSLSENTNKFMKFIREFVKAQAEAKADIILPPVPVITADSPDYMIDIWYEVIKTTGILAKTLAEKNSAILIDLNFNLFRRPQRLEKLLEKLLNLSSESSISDIKTIILKVHKLEELESDTAETRIRFKRFIVGITNYATITGRITFMLDISSIGLASISNGIDGFIEPMNGVTGVGIAFSKEKRGRYYHPEGLKFVRFQDIREFYENNNSNLPCHCPFCNKINGKHMDNEMKMNEWNLARRGHLVLCRNSEIDEFNKTIDENTTSNAIVDKIQRSDMKNLLDILPK
jgi:hypothetical protein